MVLERFAEFLTPTTACGAAALTFVTWLSYKSIKDSSRRYPPGPPRLIPGLGSLAYMPQHRAWETYEKWGKQYNSDILHLQGAGLNVIILNSLESATELMDKRSAIYSSRPDFSIVEISGWEWLMSNMLYTPAWRERRKLFQKHFHPSKPEVFQSRFLTSIRERLIPLLMEEPDNWVKIFRYVIGSTTISLSYGIPFNDGRNSPNPTKEELEDPGSLASLIKLAEEAVLTINAAYASGAIIVDLIPPLKHFPSWFPGLGFKAAVPVWRRLANEFRERPFTTGKKLIEEGKAEESFLSLCIDNGDKELDVVRDTAAMMFAGGVDTTLALLHNFILAILLHPEAQQRAQEELDKLLQAERRQQPEWIDADKLPYIAALLKEVLRWRPVLPLGAPHAVIQDDEYKGYFIPKDSLIIPNAWLMLHNRETYGPEPDKFRPERFLDAQGRLNQNMPDPEDVAFGFGRRVCPGAHVATYNLFMVATHVLAAFRIEPVLDENGAVKTPSMDWPNLVVCGPLPFECKFVPRASARK
ncbi:O-methylsterigmatocystin oxidoreductase [Leucoagaricus sp. SymC.cos]|nr:O-methylsterigmatocystin oxidoreductase [Leucoagaricus sp. SymC.cos]